MKGSAKTATRCLIVAMSLAAVMPAKASLVFDIPNFIVNKLSLLELKKIHKELSETDTAGTVNYNTYETNVTTQLNYDIDTDFTWIINQNGGEIIPIPDPVLAKLKRVMGEGGTEAYTAHFKAAGDLGDLPEGGYENGAAWEGSRARKAANDALVEAVSHEQNAVDNEYGALVKIVDLNRKTQGHGNQLQIANALAGTQVQQMMKLRSMIMVSESARAAEMQVAADKDARAIAVSDHLRAGLKDAARQTLVVGPKF
jgi:conjugal transfer/entry exclusion protein